MLLKKVCAYQQHSNIGFRQLNFISKLYAFNSY